jgi:gliding motility-associated-like protein
LLTIYPQLLTTTFLPFFPNTTFMRKLMIMLTVMFAATFAKSQDLALASPSGLIQSPVSGCGLTSTETVTVRVFNFGPTLVAGNTFNVSYTINGGAAVTETVTLTGNFTTNSTFTYNFTTLANLSAAGTYTLTATVSLAGDVNSANDTYTGYTVTNNSLSVGGTIDGDTNLCITTNGGVLTLSGHTGNVLNWEYSTDGVTWLSISNTTTTQSYTDLTVQTYYRARVQNAACTVAFSDTATLTIDPATVGGTVTPASTSVCTGANGATLTLSGFTGTILSWQSSTNNFATFTTIANTGTTQAYLNLTSTTKYRAVIQSGACPSANSSNGTVTVSPNSVGGTINPDTSYGCAGANSGTLTLSGQVGTNQGWQISSNGTTFANVSPANTTSTLNYSNLAGTRWYRVTIKSGGCASTRSDTAVVIISAATVPGTLSSNATVCTGTNSGTITLSGNSGTVSNWESSTDNGALWTVIPNTTTSETYTNLTATTIYRALVQNAGCTTVYTDTVQITVDTLTNPGTTGTAATVCMGSNSGSVNVSGNNGSVLNWISSTDGGTTWSNITNTSNTESFTNLDSTTLFAAVIQNGVCPADTSTSVQITIDSTTLAGTVSVSDTVCSGNNAGTLTLTGSRGNVINWEYSTDGGLTWVNVVNTTTSQSFNNLTQTTMFRALVQNGVCSSAYSANATITVDVVPVAGTTYGSTTVCEGTNSGTITLIGANSTINFWQFSTDGGSTWTNIANTTSSNTFTNLADTTFFRAVVGAGVCPNDTSSITPIFTDIVSVGGIISLDDTVCGGSNKDTLVLTGNVGNVTNWQVSTDGGNSWITLSNTTSSQIYNNLSATTMYQAQVKNGVCPATASSIATITVDAASDAGTISSSASVCEGSNAGTLTVSGVTGTLLDWESSTDGVTWTSLANTGNTQTYLNLTDTTWFHTIAVNGVCANDTGSAAKITVNPRPVALFTAPDTCQGNPTVFTNSTSVSAGYIQLYSWDFGDNNNSVTGNPIYTYADSGTYNVTLVALSNLGCLDTANVSVKVKGLPSVVFTASGPYEFCANDSLVLSVPLDTMNTYLWSPTGDTINQIVIDTSGTWSIMVTNSVTGCFNSDSVITVVFPVPVANAGADDTLNLGSSVTLLGTGGITYNWAPAATLDFPTIQQPTATPTVTTTYTLTVSDINGCSDDDSVTIVVNTDITLEINTVITPNGDGFNDVWFIKNVTSFPDNEVTIFNRYGQKVFAMSTYDNSWDGTFNGQPVPDGTYYYALKFTSTDKEYTGAITVLRSSK